MVCPVTPDDDFNAAFGVLFVVILAFSLATAGYRRSATHSEPAPQVEAEASGGGER
jgi:hypothetical protein